MTDHTNDFYQLYDAAHQANLNVPNAIEAEHNRTMIDPFQKLKDADFDRRYVREMVQDAVNRVPNLGSRGADLKQQMQDKLIEPKHCIEAHGQDMPEIRNWKWSATK